MVQFNTEYERYLRQIAALNTCLEEDKKLKPVGYKECFDGQLLMSSIELGFWPGATKPSQANDAMVKTWLDTRSHVKSENTSEQVTNVLANIRYKPSRKDPEGAAMEFFVCVLTELRRNRLSEIIKIAPKFVINTLIPKLEPRQ